MGAPPFDMSAMQNVLNDPEIKRIAEMMSQDPAFKAMTDQLQGSLAGGAAAGAPSGDASREAPAMPGMPPGGMPGMPPGGMPPGMMPPGMDPQAYSGMMQSVLGNPEFAKMAESIGKKIFESDPNMKRAMQSMQEPAAQTAMKERFEKLKDDPEIAPIMEELEKEGPTAMMKYWNDPEAMKKLSKAFEDIPGFMPGMSGLAGAPGMAVPAEGEDDDEEEEEEDDDMADAPALLKAAMDGELDKVKQCITDGGKDFAVDVADKADRTALHFACGYGEHEIAKVLLAAKASVTAVDNDKNTALHYAAGYGQLECVQLLLDHGAGLTDKNGDGKTALEVAELNEKEDISKLLREKEEETYL